MTTSNETGIPFINIFKRSWVNSDDTPKLWLQVFRTMCNTKRGDITEEDKKVIAELGGAFESAMADVVMPRMENSGALSLPNFVGLIYDTELYTRYMKGIHLTKEQMTKLLEVYNELSTEQSLSLEDTAITTTSSTIVTGVVHSVDVQESSHLNQEQEVDSDVDDIDTIVKSLAPAIGISTTGSICSSISIQQNGNLCQLKYPETNGYAIIEVNLARCSKVKDLDSREAWKAYDFRTKIVVQSPTHHIHILAMKLIKNITASLKQRKDGKKMIFKRQPISDQDLTTDDSEPQASSSTWSGSNVKKQKTGF